MKRIIYISPDAKVKGGISTVLKNYLNSDLKNKYNILCVSSHVDGLKIKKLFQAIIGLIKLLFYLILYHVDIVHLHGSDVISSKRKYIYFRLASQFGCKTIYHFHGGFFLENFPRLSKYWKKSIIYMFEKSDVLICLSNSWAIELKKIAPNSNIVVIKNSVNMPHLENNNKKRKTLALLFLGLIDQGKGVFDLLKVFNRLIDDGNVLELNIGGNGRVKKLLSTISAFGLEKNVNYLGWISEEKRNYLYRNTDLYILPSYAEGMPMSILEAMSYGIPVISTNVGGIPELVDDGKTGLLFNPGELNIMYENIKLLINNDELRKRMGCNGRIKIEEKHKLLDHIRKIDNIYDSL